MTSVVTPETRFVRSGDVDIAYQVVGQGERDIVVGIGWVSHLELLWELPETVHFLRRLQSCGRLILYDARGTGLSDRPARPATIDDLAEDLVAVLDAVGSERAVILGWVDKAAAAIALAARHPDRVEALVLGEALATTVARDDDPEGLDPAVIENLAAAVEQGSWGTGALLPAIAPSVARDPRIAAWWRRWERMSATPNMAAGMLRTLLDLDVRALLPAVTAPTLVLHRAENMLVPSAAVRRLARDLPDGRLVELPGADLAAFFGDTDALVDEIEEFLTGTRTGADSDRAVLTMLVTDVVGSTALAAELGDHQWNELLDFHHREVRAALARHGGSEVDTAGDGFLAVFALPSRALACAREARERLAAGGLTIRAGLHCAEVVHLGAGVRGLGVHVAARVAAGAGPGEIRATGTVADLVAGTRAEFEELGEATLSGVPGHWRLTRLVDARGDA